MSEKLALALEYRRNSAAYAESNLRQALEDDYPVGGNVEWSRGGHRQFGRVLRHLTRGRVEVKNEKTGKTLCVDVYDILKGWKS